MAYIIMYRYNVHATIEIRLLATISCGLRVGFLHRRCIRILQCTAVSVSHCFERAAKASRDNGARWLCSVNKLLQSCVTSVSLFDKRSPQASYLIKQAVEHIIFALLLVRLQNLFCIFCLSFPLSPRQSHCDSSKALYVLGEMAAESSTKFAMLATSYLDHSRIFRF